MSSSPATRTTTVPPSWFDTESVRCSATALSRGLGDTIEAAGAFCLNLGVADPRGQAPTVGSWSSPLGSGSAASGAPGERCWTLRQDANAQRRGEAFETQGWIEHARLAVERRVDCGARLDGERGRVEAEP